MAYIRVEKNVLHLTLVFTYVSIQKKNWIQGNAFR